MSALQQQIMADSPVAYWPLNDGTATTAKDRSGNAHDITWGSAPAQGAMSPLPGRGVTVDGSITGTGDTDNNLRQNSGSFEGWFVTSTTGSTIALASHRSVANGWALYLTAAGSYLQLNVDGTTATPLASTQVINDGKLHHVVATWAYSSATVGTIYYDGLQVASGTIIPSGSMLTATETFYLASEAATRRFNGSVAHAAVYGSALSAARVAAHYAAGLRSGVAI